MTAAEGGSLVLALLAALLPLVRGGSLPRLLAALAAVLAGLGLWLGPAPAAGVEALLPARVADRGYVSSDACRACHPGEWQTWHRSFHRTMTQAVSPATALGDFGGVTLEHDGKTIRLERRGERLIAEMTDPDWEQGMIQQGLDPSGMTGPRVERQVVMSTGSHHQQTYWVRLSTGKALWQLPWVWLIEARRWIPADDAFLRTPGLKRGGAIWNLTCFACHSVATIPDPSPEAPPRERMASVTAELGIACEACHGPAGEHAAANRDPLRRYRAATAGSDATVVNPARLARRKASEVCGQCHTVVTPRDVGAALTHGIGFRPGGELSDVLDLSARWDALGNFWGDGTCRVGGREYHAMTASTCYTKGDLSCLDCHRMHGDEPDDQLAPGMRGDAACTGCHAKPEYRGETHTHHRAGSSGSVCLNCHMPHTSYALFKAIRRHRIDSPTVAETLDWGRPNACNLCHLDRPLGWTAEHLERWYGQAPPALDADDRRIALAVRLATGGDAAQRALVAWHMGWAPAVEASSRDRGAWMVPYLARLLTDDYAVVRYIAGRSLRSHPGFEALGDDFLAPAARREQVREEVLARWRAGARPSPAGEAGAVLLTGDGALDEAEFSRLVAGRRENDIHIAE